MNHTDRRAMGIETFFAGRSASFTGLRDLTPEMIKTRLGELPFRVRQMLIGQIFDGVSALRGLGGHIDRIIPSRIALMSDKYYMFSRLRTKPVEVFFNWLLELSEKNEQDRIERISMLNTTAARLEKGTGSLMRSVFSLNNQRVSVRVDENDITVSFAEREWGRAAMHFGGCSVEHIGADTTKSEKYLPQAAITQYCGVTHCALLGYLFGTESRVLPDGRYELRMLIDTRMAEDEYYRRMLDEDGWVELAFTCDDIRAEVNCCDYVGHMRQMGTSRVELVERACSVLVNKHILLGGSWLSEKENSMLPTATLMYGADGMMSKDKSTKSAYEDMLLDSLANRYAMNKMEMLLGQSGCPILQKCLAESKDACSDEDEDKALKSAGKFISFYERQVADGSARLLLKTLSEKLCDMTADFADSTPKMRAQKNAAKKVESLVQPRMEKMQFSGCFPHYKRRRAGYWEYLSFMLYNTNEIPYRGKYPVFVSLAAARINEKRAQELEKSGLCADDNALDCYPEFPYVSDYAELAAEDDGEVICVETELYDHGQETDSVRAESMTKASEKIFGCMDMAEHQFRKGVIPAAYARKRRRAQLGTGVLSAAMLSSLPYGVIAALVLAIIYIFAAKRLLVPMLSISAALLCTVGAWAVISLVITLFRRIISGRKLWRTR